MSASLSPPATSILVLGTSNTGKTHYIVQLFGRLRANAGALKLRESPESFAAFESALTQLNQGLPATHTATDAFDELRLPMAAGDGTPLDLVLPDYGGEQVRAMMDERQITPEWKSRVRAASGWLLFLRPNDLVEERDVVSRPIEELLGSPPQKQPRAPAQWSDQTRFIELLQLLLFARGANLSRHLSTPVMGIILSCWDELGATAETSEPEVVLRGKLPLLADFVEANWNRASWFVLGLSSLERPLDEKNADEEFINRGPEQFGYVVGCDGGRSTDLTLPLAEVLARC